MPTRWQNCNWNQGHEKVKENKAEIEAAVAATHVI
jgi:hypothetical protein